MSNRTVSIAVVFLGVLILLFFGIDLWRDRDTSKPQFDFSGVTRPTAYRESPAKGAARPKAVIYEYADFNCPHCGEFQAVISRILSTYGDEVRLVWKDFPFLSQASRDAAAAARCAGEQGKFWEYANWLFANQGDVSSLALEQGAASLALDGERFTACLEDDTIQTLVERDFAEGQALGIDQTPTLVIGDVALVGTQTFEEVERLLTPLLQGR